MKFKRNTDYFIIAMLFVWCVPGYTQDCSLIESDIKRLECFDKEYKTPDFNKNGEQHASNDNSKFIDRFSILADRETFKLTPYNPIYFFPLAYAHGINSEPFQGIETGSFENIEVKFQISTRLKISDNILNDRLDLWFGYTQKTFWQMYNGELSSLFRETNYQPEFWFNYQTAYDFFGMKNRYIDFGITHESNGRGEQLSRSWNRLFVRFGLERNNLLVELVPWVRIKESAAQDENPDIEDYIGRGEVRLIYLMDEHILATVIRNNLGSADLRGSFELNYVFPVKGRLRGMLQYFEGYGESLLDYNVRMERISLGLVLINWL